MRSIVAILTMVLITPPLAVAVIVASLLGVRNRPGGLYDRAPRFWARVALRAAGVRVVLHGEQALHPFRPRVFASNHVSWFDIFTLLAILPRYRFVAKAELFRIPLFGRAARAAGTIPIERENRKAAFQAYDEAAAEIRGGASVVVCPEGTRGDSYSLRPFKKGPFVLAIAAQVPVVPVVVHGTREIQPRGSYRIRSGTVNVHFLEEIPTAGMDYEDRDHLADVCWRRMAEAMEREHAVHSVPGETRSRMREGRRRLTGTAEDGPHIHPATS